MRKLTYISFLLLLCLSSRAIAQRVAIDGEWKYSLSNDSAYYTKNFADNSWLLKKTGNLLFNEQELKGEKAWLWLRKTVVIPSALKQHLQVSGALAIYLGRMYQSDELFFNGKLIGKTNSSDIKRIYLLDPALVDWDHENTIAIRLRHWGDKAGLESAQLYIDKALPADFIQLQSAMGVSQGRAQVPQKKTDYPVHIVNCSLKGYDAVVDVSFYNDQLKEVKVKKQRVRLEPGTQTVKFRFSSPSKFLKIQYYVTIPALNFVATRNEELGYDDIVYHPKYPLVKNEVADHFISPDYQQQTIKGWLGKRMDANLEKRLNQVDEEAILAGYINKPGDHPWIGEHAGKFLDAASNTYSYTHDVKLKAQLDRTAQKLIASQLANGYLGTYTPENYWTSWDVWSHKYNIIGLLRYYAVSGYEPALKASKKAGDLLCRTFGKSKGQLDLIEAGSHVGMAATSVLEPMVDLYRFTGDKKYLDFCKYIIASYDQPNGPKIISTLDQTGRVDKTANAKAYEMLSNLLGIIKLYRLTGDTYYLKPVLAAWKDIVSNRLYITGTASTFEHFQGDDDLPATDKDNIGEGCVTTTWVQLNYQLLCIFGELKYVNELERSVYNHLAGAENPESGCVSYYTPLIGTKPYRCVITCCMSSVPRGISMIPLFANGKINQMPAFLFYQPGTYRVSDQQGKNLAFTTSTEFPANGQVSIKVAASDIVKERILFRKPYWAHEFVLRVNGVTQNTGSTDQIVVDRTWKNGDKIDINFKLPLMLLDGGKTYAGRVALQRGPQVLTFDQSLNDIKLEDLMVDPNKLSVERVDAQLPAGWIGGESYEVKSGLSGAKRKVILVPFADASQTGGVMQTWLKSSGN